MSILINAEREGLVVIIIYLINKVFSLELRAFSRWTVGGSAVRVSNKLGWALMSWAG